MAVIPKIFAEFIEHAGGRRYFKDSRFNPVSKSLAMTSPVGLDETTGQLYSIPYSLSDMIPFKITMQSTSTGRQIDKTFDEIKNAYLNGRRVFLDVGDEMLPIQPSVYENPTFFNFSDILLVSHDIDMPKTILYYFATIYSDNSITYNSNFMQESTIKPDKILVYDNNSHSFLSGFSTTNYYNELVEATESNIHVRCEVLCGMSRFYLDLKRHLYDAQHENENMFVFTTQMYNEDITGGWWMQLNISKNNNVWLVEGESNMHEV